jgi:hypothetical protein
MTRRGLLWVITAFVSVPWVSLAGEVEPRKVRFANDRLSLGEALLELEKQTGNTIKDQRSSRTNPTIALSRDAVTFWQALDAIGKQSGVGFSAYQPDGGVALVDRSYRELRTHHSGLFRFSFKGVWLSRNEETGAHLCQITLAVAWEPRLRLLYLNLEDAETSHGKSKQAIARQTVANVTGMSATDIELRTEAPPRSVQKIDQLQGKLRVVGAQSVLEFKLADLGGAQIAEQQGVKVRARPAIKTAKRWTVELETTHSEGALGKVQSFQQGDLEKFLCQRVWLSWYDTKAKKTVELDKSGEADSRTGILYTFTANASTPLPPKGADVALHYRTPSRMVTFTVPFSFRDLPLP